jgi:F0F1-type ATP synthase gamma subunit
MISKTEVSIQELSSLIGTLNATVEAVIPASLYVRELRMLQTKIVSKAQRNDQKMIKPPSEFQRADKLVATAIRTIKRKTNPNVSKSRLSDRNRCFKTGWGQYVSLKI